jgi:hypothetical protein
MTAAVFFILLFASFHPFKGNSRGSDNWLGVRLSVIDRTASIVFFLFQHLFISSTGSGISHDVSLVFLRHLPNIVFAFSRFYHLFLFI